MIDTPAPAPKPLTLAAQLIALVQVDRRLSVMLTLLSGVFVFVGVTLLLNVAMLVIVSVLLGQGR